MATPPISPLPRVPAAEGSSGVALKAPHAEGNRGASPGPRTSHASEVKGSKCGSQRNV
eukprot:CAMPEP_0118877338 /NCGR_PEP_ID=MMETSP1163-20130328/17669_1 /TAXON_ID=124430 /ORGANISM="Phaeomonas parva, Strain CCMP2877" /LENGTH=57 /DNA_ID=CAMNT_0006813033 /DNA_START=188 /DNA_END=357 /DNA_ORIENTATION=-